MKTNIIEILTSEGEITLLLGNGSILVLRTKKMPGTILDVLSEVELKSGK